MHIYIIIQYHMCWNILMNLSILNLGGESKRMTDYEESYKNYLAWLTPRELLQEYKIMRFPWRYRERKWIKEEIESRCVY